MTNVLILYVATFFLPLLFHSWRLAVLGLGVQGLLLAILLAHHHEAWTMNLAFECACLLLIRGLFLPWYLFRRMRLAEEETDVLAYLALVPTYQYRKMQGVDPASEFSLISKNLLQWTLAFLLLGAAFFFGHKMAPNNLPEAWQVGTAAGAIVIGLLVLANQNHPLGQIIGLFTFEGGVTLVELLTPHVLPFSVSLGVSLVFVIFVLTSGQYLNQILAIPPGPDDVQNKEVL